MPTEALDPRRTALNAYDVCRRHLALAVYGTGVAELLRMPRRDTVVIGGGATNRGVETSVREAFNMDLQVIVVRECCWSGDLEAHEYSLNKALAMFGRVRTLAEVEALLVAGGSQPAAS